MLDAATVALCGTIDILKEGSRKKEPNIVPKPDILLRLQ